MTRSTRSRGDHVISGDSHVTVEGGWVGGACGSGFGESGAFGERGERGRSDLEGIRWHSYDEWLSRMREMGVAVTEKENWLDCGETEAETTKKGVLYLDTSAGRAVGGRGRGQSSFLVPPCGGGGSSPCLWTLTPPVDRSHCGWRRAPPRWTQERL